MSRKIILDAGPLGKIAHPRPNPEITNWLQDVLSAGDEVIIPEIADYEVRRNLLLSQLTKSIERLDHLKKFLTYLPLTTDTMLKAAELWANARKTGQPTADSKELDADVILAAQTIREGGIVATENIGHLSRFVAAKHWQDIVSSNTISIPIVEAEYPLKDFLEDLNELHTASQSKIIDFPPTLKITNTDRWLISPTDPNYRVYVHYIRKYGNEIGLARCYRYFQVMAVLHRDLEQLQQAGPIKVIPDGFDVADDLFEHLLSLPFQKESGSIPEDAVQLYLSQRKNLP